MKYQPAVRFTRHLNKWNYFGLGAVTLLVLVMVWWRSSFTDRAEAHAMGRTGQDLVAVASELSDSIARGLIELDGRSSNTVLPAELVFSHFKQKDYSITRENWERAGVVIDRWGRPLTIMVEHREKPMLRIISAGANGRYEEGKGDDLIYEEVLREIDHVEM